jgi:hypothetical protein
MFNKAITLGLLLVTIPLLKYMFPLLPGLRRKRRVTLFVQMVSLIMLFVTVSF